jgi:hypothetical protein
VRLGHTNSPPGMDSSTRRRCGCLDCSVFCDKPCLGLAAASGWRCSLCDQRGCEGSKYRAAEAEKAAAEAEVSPPQPSFDLC